MTNNKEIYYKFFTKNIGFSKGIYKGLNCGISSKDNPFDVIKTRRQIQASNPKLFNYTSAIDCAKQLMAKEGPMAFFDGLSGRVAWLLPRCAFAMTGFEYVYAKLQ